MNERLYMNVYIFIKPNKISQTPRLNPYELSWFLELQCVRIGLEISQPGEWSQIQALHAAN